MTKEQIAYYLGIRSYDVFAFRNGLKKKVHITSFENGKRFAGNFGNLFCHADNEKSVLKGLGFSPVGEWFQPSLFD